MTQAQIDSLINQQILSGARRTKGEMVRSLLKDITRAYANLEEGGTYSAVLKYAETVDITDYQDLVNYGFVDANYTSKYEFDQLYDQVQNINPSTTWGNIIGTVTDQTDLITYLNSTHEKLSNKGIAGGYVPLNGSTKIDASYLPSYVDDVEEYANFASFPVTGETGKIYIAIDTTNQYRWSGSAYVQITNSSAVWGNISGTITNQTDLTTYLSTNYQAKSTNLTSLAALSYASTSFVKMTAAGTFALDTNTYASSSDLTAYAKLDGTNQPFTGNIRILKNFASTYQFTIEAPSSSLAAQLIKAGSGASQTVLDMWSVSSSNLIRFFKNGGQDQTFSITDSGTTVAIAAALSYNMRIEPSGTGFLQLKGSHGGSNGNTVSLVNGTGIACVTQQDFYVQNDGDTNRIQWTASSSQLKLRESSSDKIIFNPTLQNSGVFNNGIKIGNNTDVAATAGGGAFKYSGGIAYLSNGSSWLQILTGTSSGTTDYLFGFTKHGTLAYEVIQADGYDGAYTNSMGFVVPVAMTLKEISVVLGSSSAGASETLTFTIRKLAVGVGNTGNGTQYSLGAGTSVTSISFVSGGAIASRFYRNQVTTGLSIALSAGDVLFCESSNFAFWSVTDAKVRLRCEI